MILINSNTRYFNVPGADLVFGVVADSDAERKHFQCPRFVGDGLDLASCFIRINYRNANGKTDFYLVDDVVIDGDNITFSWLLSPKVTEYRGQVKFVMCAVGPDLKLKWHTTQGTGQVMEGLEPDNSHVESQTADVVAQLIAMVEEQTSTVEKVGAEQVATIKSATETHRTAAVNEIEAKGVNTRNSIPNDYTALSGTVEGLVRNKAGGIVCHAEGEAITLNDASDNGFRGLRIFGRSTQDGTPTPENPVDIVSIENPTVTVCGKNLFTGWIVGGITPEGADYAGTNHRRTNYILIAIPGQKYMVSGIPNTLYTMAAFYDANKSFIRRTDGGNFGNRLLEPPPNAKYFRLSIYESSNTSGKIAEADATENVTMIEAGTVVTEYEPTRLAIFSVPHSLPGIPVTSGGNYTDASGQQWICDEVDFERGVYVHRIGFTDLSDARWVKNDSGKYYYNKDRNVYSPAHRLLCTHIIGGSAYEGVRNDVIIFSNDNCDIRLNVVLDDDTVEAVQEIMNGATLIGVLVSPTETPLSETELAAYRALHTNKPNTTILNDSGAYMSVDYTADTKLYIDNKIKEALL